MLLRAANKGGMFKSLGAIVLISCAAAVLAYGGTELHSGKEMKDIAAEVGPTPCPEYYGDRELNVSLWGTYAWAGNNGHADIGNSFNFNRQFATVDLSQFFSSDRYLETDHAWGGGVDLKYFFFRYFGVGVEGFLLDAKRNTLDIEASTPPLITAVTRGEDRRTIGSAKGTLTLRYPIHCSRLSPYVWVGAGAIFNGGERDILIVDNVCGVACGGTVRTERRGSQTEAIGQFGGGLEFRFTRHLGWLNDFSWNVVDGPDNNFGMLRSGLNFSF
jgi:hypothetical protein